MPCLEDQVVLRFVTGGLDGAARAAVEAELARCGRCAALVAAVARSDDEGTERYALGAVIARGGMGTIVAATDRSLGRPVALKRLDARGDAARARFDREIRVTAALQHPNIVPIHDAGLLPDGRPFYVMRHIPGRSLEEVIVAATDPPARLALLAPITAAADAVAYAHERGVIHRDLKPLNVLVGPFGETLVIDWGLAKLPGEAAIGAPEEIVVAEGSGDVVGDVGAGVHETRDGAILGTPRYMSPEQARGEPVTPASDVYALGAILHHALAGSPPIASSRVDDAIGRHAAGAIDRLRDVAPGLPRDLTAIVERALALDAAARYPTAAELAADLRRFQTGQLVEAYRYSGPDRVKRFAVRHRLALAIAGVAALAGVASVVRIVNERDAASAARTRAEVQRVRADRERGGAEGLVDFMLVDLRRSLAAVGRLDALGDVADRVDAYLDGKPDASAGSLRARARVLEVRAAVADARGDATRAEELGAEAFAVLERADAIEPSTRSRQVRAALTSQAALRASARGDMAGALAKHLEAAALWRAASAASDDPEPRIALATTLSSVAEMSERLGKSTEAEAAWHEAEETLDVLLARRPDDRAARLRLAVLHLGRGQASARHGDPAAAERELARALEVVDVAAASGDVISNELRGVTVAILNQLADARARQGRVAEAVPLHTRVHALVRDAVAMDPSSARWRSELARSWRGLAVDATAAGDAATAAQRLASAVDEYARLVATNPSDRGLARAAAVAQAELADALGIGGELAAARAAYAAAVVRFEAIAKPGDAASQLDVAYALRQAAVFERVSGKRAAAARLIARALSLVHAAPVREELPVELYYRAAVLHEAVALGHRASRKPMVALLDGLAKRKQLLPAWRAELGGPR